MNCDISTGYHRFIVRRNGAKTKMMSIPRDMYIKITAVSRDMKNLLVVVNLFSMLSFVYEDTDSFYEN